MRGRPHPNTARSRRVSLPPRICFRGSARLSDPVERPYDDRMNKNIFSLRLNLVGFGLAAAAASQASGFIDLRLPNTGQQQNIVQQGVFSVSAFGSVFSANSNTVTNI